MKNISKAVLAGTVFFAFTGIICPEGFAEEEIFFGDPGDVVVEEYIGDTGVSGQGGGTVSGEKRSRKNNDEADEDAPLIEDEEFEVVREGADLEEVLKAEDEAEAAARAVQDFMDREAIYIPGAEAGSVAGYLQKLLQEPSPTGSDGELIIGRYISETMKELGYTVSEQTFHEGFLNENMVDVPGINIIAERGADSEHRSGQIVVICAHYDSRTITESEALDPAENETEISGDDGTSIRAGEYQEDPLENDKTGVAALLECARLLSDVPSDVDLCFLFCSGEEDGNFGSLRFAESLKDEIKGNIRAVICVGPVGYKGKVIEGSAENPAENPDNVQIESSGKEQETDEDGPYAGKGDFVLPSRLGTVSGLGNEPADLIRSTALYRKAEYMLGSDAEEEGDASFSQDGSTSSDEGISPEEGLSPEAAQALAALTGGNSEDTGAGTENVSGVDSEEGTAASEQEQAWEIVKAEKGMHKAFDDAGLSSVFLYQETGSDPGSTESTESTEGTEAGGDGSSVVWLDMSELTKTADLIAETIGLYMQLP